MNNDKGIKELGEALIALKVLAIAVKKIFKDGKVNVADLPVLMELVGKQQEILAGFKDANLIGAEVKDMSTDEAMQVVAQVVAVLGEFKAA